MPDDDDKIVIVCLSSNAPLAVKGSTFDKTCRVCGTHVMVAPSGQEYLRAHPEAEVMCLQCFQKSNQKLEDCKLAAPDKETILREVRSAEPNRHRNRN